jgi:ribosomal protein L4
VNRKVNKQALHSALISKKTDTMLLETIKPMEKPSLKKIINIFSLNELDNIKTLLVLESFDENFIKSCQNLKNVNIKM